MLDVNYEYTIRCIQLVSVQKLFRCDSGERHESVNDF